MIFGVVIVVGLSKESGSRAAELMVTKLLGGVTGTRLKYKEIISDYQLRQ